MSLRTSIQHRFNTFQHGGKGVAKTFNIAIQQNRKDVEANVEAVCKGLYRATVDWHCPTNEETHMSTLKQKPKPTDSSDQDLRK